MGACASRFSVSKDAGDAPVTRELKLDESNVPVSEEAKGEVVAAADDEAKRQSLGHLFEQFEKEMGSVEQPPLENEPDSKSRDIEIAKLPEPVIDVPANDELQKVPETHDLKVESSEETTTEDVELKPEIQILEAKASEKKEDEKPAEIESAPKVEASVKVLDPHKVEDENKPVEKSDAEKKVEEKVVVVEVSVPKVEPEKEKSLTDKKVVEPERKIEDKTVETKKLETLTSENVSKSEAEKSSTDKKVETKKVEEEKSVLDTEEKITEEKPVVVDTKKPEASPEGKDKQGVVPVEVEKLVPSNQPAAADTKAGTQVDKKPASNEEKP